MINSWQEIIVFTCLAKLHVLLQYWWNEFPVEKILRDSWYLHFLTDKPAFDPDMASTAWTWKNAPGNLTCLVRGEPRPTVEWYSIPNENGDRSKIEEESFYSISTKYIDANTVQSILRVFYIYTHVVYHIVSCIAVLRQYLLNTFYFFFIYHIRLCMTLQHHLETIFVKLQMI